MIGIRGALSGLLVGMVGAQNDPRAHPSSVMNPEMKRAIHFAEEKCARDVELLCPSPDQLFHQMARPVFRLGAPRDPFTHLLLNPSAPPPSLDDIPSMLDEMLTQAITMAHSQPTSVVRVYRFTEEPHTQTMEPASREPQASPHAAPENVLDSMVKTLLERSNDRAKDVVQKIVEHGNEVLVTSDDKDRVSMARRLTQVTAEPSEAQFPLSFGYQRTRCLMSAYEQAAVSLPCGGALRSLEQAKETSTVRPRTSAVMVEKESNLFLHFTFLYIVLAVFTLCVLRKHIQRVGAQMREHMRLRKSILQAVYSNPAIKARVEEAVGEGVGEVPPLPPHVLAEMGGHPFPHRGFFVLKMLKLTIFAAILTLVFVNPLLAMPILCILMFARFLHLSFCPPEPPVLMCSCCCCGGTTEDVKNGTISAEQECCTCCKGTGVCPPACADCCGLDPHGSCSCCSDGCNCCDGSDKCDAFVSMKESFSPNTGEVCSCCCCGGTTDDVKNGTVSVEQECCTCCKGTGACPPACADCCGTDPNGSCDCCHDGCHCCDGSDECNAGVSTDGKPVRVAENAVYAGIPIQIV